ncbi:MAG: mitomycin resistance protein [Chlorobiaceae bacterium]|nr:mitomycin resistance protein [Chlorobiaceae bacterium]
MNPAKVSRSRLKELTDLPNIGTSIARDLRQIGISSPEQLAGRSALEMYHDLCRITDTRQDPCVLDVFMSVTSFMSGGEPRTWWSFTEERKRLLRKEAPTGTSKNYHERFEDF